MKMFVLILGGINVDWDESRLYWEILDIFLFKKALFAGEWFNIQQFQKQICSHGFGFLYLC